MRHRSILILAVFCIVWSAQHVQGQSQPMVGRHTIEEFKTYWYPNGAEISRYTLKQARYGEIHQGDAVLVFVTEALNPSTQIKADHPQPENVPILKLNASRKFYTGLYPYSVLTSVFAPLDAKQYPLPLKISTSVQEWCGHVFMQMNYKGPDYAVQQRSYFEKDGDRNFTLSATLSEDALWTRLRIAPETLPQGEFDLISGTLYSRLVHKPMKVQRVSARLAPHDQQSLEGNPLVVYTVDIPQDQRSLKIFFEAEFPYRIQGWEDTYQGLPHMGTKALTTHAERTHTLMIDYWNRHRDVDRNLQTRLGLNGNL